LVVVVGAGVAVDGLEAGHLGLADAEPVGGDGAQLVQQLVLLLLNLLLPLALALLRTPRRPPRQLFHLVVHLLHQETNYPPHWDPVLHVAVAPLLS
jgi:hypothetical protein